MTLNPIIFDDYTIHGVLELDKNFEKITSVNENFSLGKAEFSLGTFYDAYEILQIIYGGFQYKFTNANTPAIPHLLQTLQTTYIIWLLKTNKILGMRMEVEGFYTNKENIYDQYHLPTDFWITSYRLV